MKVVYVFGTSCSGGEAEAALVVAAVIVTQHFNDLDKYLYGIRVKIRIVQKLMLPSLSKELGKLC